MQVDGVVRVPGDKSLTHRVLMLAALARGTSLVRRPLASLDARSTARALRALGASVGALRADAAVRVTGRGGFRAPARAVHCGNAGTAARLLLGLLAASPVGVTLTGDRSLRRRPMRRVTEPLGRMGARFQPDLADRLPLTITGGPLEPLRWDLPVSSAQVKSALLLAGVTGRVAVSLREPDGLSRDHTERLLRRFGYRVDDVDGRIEFEPTGALEPFDATVPGDPSSAAFLVGAAVLASRGALEITGVGLNPTRTRFLDVLRRMGAQVEAETTAEALGEPVGTIRAAASALHATEVAGHEVPALVDEVPLLAVVAARAEGETVFHDVGELRVKESDRLGLIARNLRAVGVRAEAALDTLTVEGTGRPLAGHVVTDGDHRLAMAFAVLGRATGGGIVVDDPRCADVSFPGFEPMLHAVTTRHD